MHVYVLAMSVMIAVGPLGSTVAIGDCNCPAEGPESGEEGWPGGACGGIYLSMMATSGTCNHPPQCNDPAKNCEWEVKVDWYDSEGCEPFSMYWGGQAQAYTTRNIDLSLPKTPSTHRLSKSVKSTRATRRRRGAAGPAKRGRIKRRACQNVRSGLGLAAALEAFGTAARSRGVS